MQVNLWLLDAYDLLLQQRTERGQHDDFMDTGSQGVKRQDFAVHVDQYVLPIVRNLNPGRRIVNNHPHEIIYGIKFFNL
ncbi:hypothetical protein D9M72_579260 [compost metagenome]